ncbi:endo-beta-1,4-glucanase [Microthyrium microscopicum]|uniref:cellulase n=1 Tax=Microthyrium microscopicum TaxID=703497 RepID=A0A6A6UBU6_9PEZI|nr:endo-beta-1,4-glucanase [Microthyrium microscopicum]
MHIHSFLPAAALATVVSAVATPRILDNTVPAKLNKFQYIGMNEAGPEFGEKVFPGKKGKDYAWPNNTAIAHFIDKGMNTFRLNFLMERLIPDKMTGSFNAEYLKDMEDSVNFVTGKGAYAMLNPHNYGRYYQKIIENPEDFKAWWTSVAKKFKDNPKVLWDTNNEYHDMPQPLVVKLNQAAIDGIRSTGATQLIHVEGNSWTGAWSWKKSGNADTMGALKDPLNKLVYHMHQYLDTDGSGTKAECVSSTIGQERLVEATQWLKANKKVGFLGEFGAGDNAQCKTAVAGMLKYMQANSDVWSGWNWWSAGPWWGPYIYSMEPKDGKAYKGYIDLLMTYT